MGFVGFVLAVLMVFIVGVIVLAIILAARSRKLVANREREIRSTADFSADDVYVSPYSRNGLAIDNARGLVMLVDTTRQRKVSFEKLVSAEVMEDNVTLMTTKRGLGGVVVGGATIRRSRRNRWRTDGTASIEIVDGRSQRYLGRRRR